MRRWPALLIAVMTMTAAFAGTSAAAGAGTPPPIGRIVCGVRGDMNFAPALPGAKAAPDGTTSTTKVTMLLGLSNCATFVAGGKAPITIGYAQLSAKIPVGDGCAVAGTSPPDITTNKNHLTIKWQYVKASGRPATVATTNTTIVSTSEIDDDTDASNLIGWELDTDAITKGAFAGTSFTFDLMFDSTSIDAITGCAPPNGGHPMSTVHATTSSSMCNDPSAVCPTR
jgi:hypothetical protein